MAGNMKKELIQVTLNILKSEGIESIKIRRIAKDAGCTSTVIYNYFENLDHLISFAAIRILKDYIRDFQEIMNNPDLNVLDRYLRLWECFARYAFEDIHIFELLFWGKYKSRLGEMMFDYFQLFKDEIEMKNFDGLSASIMFSNDLPTRSRFTLRKAAAEGVFSFDDVLMLSDLLVSLFHGMLLEYKDRYREPGVAQEGAEKFLGILHSIIGKYCLLPDLMGNKEL